MQQCNIRYTTHAEKINLPATKQSNFSISFTLKTKQFTQKSRNCKRMRYLCGSLNALFYIISTLLIILMWQSITYYTYVAVLMLYFTLPLLYYISALLNLVTQQLLN